MNVKKEAGYFDGYTEEDSGKVGAKIHGKDIILLDAAEVRVSPDTPLLTNAQDVAGAINELFQLDPGGGDTDKWTRPSDWPQLDTPEDNEIRLLIANLSKSAIQFAFTEYKSFSSSSYNSTGNKLIVDWGDGTIETIVTTGSGNWFVHTYTDQQKFYVVSIKQDLENTDCYFSIAPTEYNGYYSVIDAHIGKDFNIFASAFRYSDLHHVKLFGWAVPHEYLTLTFANFWGGKLLIRQVETSVPWTVIPKSIFAGCRLLEKFDFSAVTEIYDGAFSSCDKLKNIQMPNLLSVGRSCFSACINLKSITAPNLNSIGNYAFNNCYNLQNISYAEDCTIGTDAFKNCFWI